MKKIFYVSIISLVLLLANTAPCAAQQKHNIDSLNTVLKEVYKLDQSVRDFSKCKTREDYIQVRNNMIRQDSINQSVVFPVIDKIISGEITELTPESWNACFFVLQHADLKDQLKYEKFVRESHKKGNITNSNISIFLDRINSDRNFAQPFGSQGRQATSGTVVMYPIQSQAEREAAFAEIGLSMDDYAIVNGATMVGKDMKKLAETIERTVEQYESVEIKKGEFAFVGAIASDKEQKKGVSNAEIRINGKKVATTDKNGYFDFKVSKTAIPVELEIVNGSQVSTYKVAENDCKGDFMFIYHFI